MTRATSWSKPEFKIGLHWLEATYERVRAGEPESLVLRDYGYQHICPQCKEGDLGTPTDFRYCSNCGAKNFELTVQKES